MADPISPPMSETTSPPPATAPTVGPTVQPHQGERWYKKHSYLFGPSATVLLGLVTFFATLWVASIRTDLRLDGALTNLDNILNRDQDEINKLRDEVATLKVTIANNVAVANLGTGRVETAINAHAGDLRTLKTEVSELCKTVAKLDTLAVQQGADVKYIRNERLDKIIADLGSLRERLAALEAGGAVRKEK